MDTDSAPAHRTTRRHRRWWPFKRKPAPPAFTCEVCRSAGVNRIGIWDHCPNGHSYVGERAEASCRTSARTPG